MRHQSILAILIEGNDITQRIERFIQSVTVSDKAGTTADMASIVLDDSAGSLTFPAYNAAISILLGFRGQGVSIVFTGTVDEVRGSGGRGGKNITISAKGIDTSSKAKEPQQRHFDNKTVEQMLKAAGDYAGVTDIRVDFELASISRKYEHMDDESFMAFGERIAKEIGGTFKMRNGIAIMAKKNSGRTPSGDPLPPVFAIHGENLHSWDIAPYIGRQRFKQIRVRYYDAKKAKHDEVILDTGVEGSDAIAVGSFRAPNKEAAQEKAESLKAESQRQSGVGTASIEGSPGAQPESTCIISGARVGIDGSYVIDAVDHKYSRSSGFTTKMELAYPT
jgi:phage protein D